MTEVATRLVGGLMSGTSMDGIDALLLRVDGEDPGSVSWRVEAFESLPWDARMRDRIRSAATPGAVDAAGILELHVELAEAFADAFLRLLDGAGVAPSGVSALGSHGQTIWHVPAAAGARGRTFQLGDPATIAERTGIPVVSDFRARDMAVGGQGAPLVPWPDRVLLHRPGVGRALQNIGGIGNVTFLPADGAWDGVLAFDTGPGVALIDGVARVASVGAEHYDTDGRRAARGTVDEAHLADLLADPFFDEPPPRSTGRERFGDARLREIVERAVPKGEAGWDDLLATLTELSARSIARAYREYLPTGAIDEVVVSGGGARNPTLIAAITRALDPLPVRTGTEALGIDPDAREAAAFALLAWAHLLGIPASLPRVTGAAGARVLGSWTPG